MVNYWEIIERIVLESDIVLELADARFPEFSRNEKIDELIQKNQRPRILVLTKSDLLSQKSLEKQKAELGFKLNIPFIFVSFKKSSSIKTLLGLIKKTFKEQGKRQKIEYKKELKNKPRETKAEIVVGLVGYPNVGKSTLINSLSFSKKAKVSKKAGTTHGLHWIRAGKEIKFIDSPGVIPLKYISENYLGLIAAIDPQKIKEPEIVAAEILSFLINKNPGSIERTYKLEPLQTMDPYEVIDLIAKSRNHLKKGGLPDEIRTSVMIIRDWHQGKLSF